MTRTREENAADLAFEESRCSICEGEYSGRGHNAQPFNNGRCCDVCHDTVVTPFRILTLTLDLHKEKFL